MRNFLLVPIVALPFFAACAGGSPPAAAPAPEPSPGVEEPQSAEPEAPPAAKPTLESQHEPFIRSCMVSAHSPEYCECGFQQFAEIFKDADLSQQIEPTDPRLKALHDKTVAECASKLDENRVKENFIEACTAGNERKSAYCNCGWQSLRKTLAVSDLIGDGQSPGFVEAKKAMVVACKGKLPVEVAKADFMSECVESKPEREKTCTCLWQKVKARFSAEELAAGVADVKSVPGLSDCTR